MRRRFRTENRLRKTSEFKQVAAEGKKVFNEFLVVNYRQRGDTGVTRLGIITSRRVGKAVVRNRLRRLVREAFRMLYPNMKKGYDIVVIVRERARNADSHTIFESFRHLMNRATICCTHDYENNR